MRVVVIGGGTGSFVVLRGLKKYVHDITAVVSMFDNGGSTGILRDEFGILPPGDVRRCLVALADESVMRDLFMYRFDENSSLKGHSFGNLLLTALTDIAGSEARAIKHASRILRITGKVLPVSLDNANLCAEFENGAVVKGEALIDVPERDPNLRITKVWLDPRAVLNPDVESALLNAELIVIGPGDLFTSVIPNLLVDGMKDVLQRARAKKVYVCNLMTKPGETSGFRVSDHVNEIVKYGIKPDFVVTSDTVVEKELLDKYAVKGQQLVECDSVDVKIVSADITSKPELVRHDSNKLAEVILDLA